MIYSFGMIEESSVGIFFQPLPNPLRSFFGCRRAGGQGDEGGHCPRTAGKPTAHLIGGGISQAKFSAVPNPVFMPPTIAETAFFPVVGYDAVISITFVNFIAKY